MLRRVFTQPKQSIYKAAVEDQVAAPAGFVNGQYVQDSRTVRELNADFLVGANTWMLFKKLVIADTVNFYTRKNFILFVRSE